VFFGSLNVENDHGEEGEESDEGKEESRCIKKDDEEIYREEVGQEDYGKARRKDACQEWIAAQWRRRIERARYDADLAERRYEEADPSNRLVASTLETGTTQCSG
jgi:hypothetical protein